MPRYRYHIKWGRWSIWEYVTADCDERADDLFRERQQAKNREWVGYSSRVNMDEHPEMSLSMHEAMDKDLPDLKDQNKRPMTDAEREERHQQELRAADEMMKDMREKQDIQNYVQRCANKRAQQMRQSGELLAPEIDGRVLPPEEYVPDEVPKQETAKEKLERLR